MEGSAVPFVTLVGKTGARGAENVSTDDMIIPRIELVQALSPARNKKDAAYVEGAEEGMLFNNVTRELYGEFVLVIPVYYVKQYLVWKDRKQGGGGSNGFRGAFASPELAREAISNLGEEGLEVSDTA
ncbi:MAG: Vibrio phage, partial [Pseudomonadota bacterium]